MNDEVSKLAILVVDDSKVVRVTAKRILQSDYTIYEAKNGLEAWDVLQENRDIAAIFCDLQMEGSDGYELLALIRGSDDPKLLNLPVIIITGNDEGDGTKRKVLDLGATDFIVKPFDAVTLKNRAAAYIGYCQKLAAVEEESEQDKLTGLANKRSFLSHGEQDLSLALRHKTELAVALFEVGDFSEIISQYGKQGAAHVLVKLSQIIENTLRREDISARVGTARFAFILPLTNRVGSLRSIERLCEKIDALAIEVDGRLLKLRISAGVTVLDASKPKTTFIQLIGEAKGALKEAIASGGGVVSNVKAQPPIEKIERELSSTAAETTPKRIDQPSTEQLITKVESGAGNSIGSTQLSKFMRSILPLVNYANKRLDLGMDESLKIAKQRLNRRE